jgi:hypothetical protein
MKQITVKATDFLKWYFHDEEDSKHLGERMTWLLMNNGSAFVDAEYLFNEQDELPADILNDVPDEEKDDTILIDRIKFINDYNK